MFEQYMEKFVALGNKMLNFGDQFGAFVIPLVILGAIALLVFARYSYKLFKIVLPVAGIIIGAIAGAKVLGSLVAKHLPAVAEFINPFYLTGIIVALAIGVFCFKFRNFTIFVIGAGLGYIVVGRIVKDFLLSIPFINQIANTTERPITLVVGIIVCLICLAITSFIVYRFFNAIYILLTSIGSAAAGLGIATMFVFESTAYTAVATLAAAGLGAVIGLVLAAKQFGEVDEY